MHSSLQVELEKGEKAFKRIKDQVSASPRPLSPFESELTPRWSLPALYSIRLNKALDSINELNSLAPEI